MSIYEPFAKIYSKYNPLWIFDSVFRKDKFVDGKNSLPSKALFEMIMNLWSISLWCQFGAYGYSVSFQYIYINISSFSTR